MTSQPPPDPYGQPQQPDPYGQGGQPPQPDPYGPSTPPPDQPQYGQPYGQPAYQPPGYPPPAAPGYGAAAQPASTNTMAIVSLVLALAGLFTFVTAPAGAILGHVAKRQIKERGEQGDGLATGGIIAGWIITGLWVLGCCGLIVAAMAADTT